VQAWKQSGEVSLLRFLGNNKLPRHNPLASLPRWDECHRAVAAAMSPLSADYTQLDTLIRNLTSSGSASGDIAHVLAVRQFKAALLAAVFHEAFLLQVLPEMVRDCLVFLSSFRGRDSTVLQG
jgi:hypothetical protein